MDNGMNRFDMQMDREWNVMKGQEAVKMTDEEISWLLRKHLGSLEKDMSVSREQKMKLISEIDYRWFGS